MCCTERKKKKKKKRLEQYNSENKLIHPWTVFNAKHHLAVCLQMVPGINDKHHYHFSTGLMSSQNNDETCVSTREIRWWHWQDTPHNPVKKQRTLPCETTSHDSPLLHGPTTPWKKCIPLCVPFQAQESCRCRSGTLEQRKQSLEDRRKKKLHSNDTILKRWHSWVTQALTQYWKVQSSTPWSN